MAVGLNGGDARGALLLEITVGKHLLGGHLDERIKKRKIPGSCRKEKGQKGDDELATGENERRDDSCDEEVGFRELAA